MAVCVRAQHVAGLRLSHSWRVSRGSAVGARSCDQTCVYSNDQMQRLLDQQVNSAVRLLQRALLQQTAQQQ
jgi:hypothetical protein